MTPKISDFDGCDNHRKPAQKAPSRLWIWIGLLVIISITAAIGAIKIPDPDTPAPDNPSAWVRHAQVDGVPAADIKWLGRD